MSARMLRLLAGIVLAAVTIVSAAAQTVPPIVGIADNPAAGPLTAAQLRTWFGSKQDYAGDSSGQHVTPAGGSAGLPLSQYFGFVSNVLAFGGVCNDDPANAAADTAALAAALAYRAAHNGGAVYVPGGSKCRLNATATVPGLVELVGDGTGGSAIHAAVTNLSPMIQVTGSGSGLRGIELNASTPGQATAGATVAVSTTASNVLIENLNINAPCIGGEIAGNTVTLRRVYVNQTAGTGCYGVRVGHNTTGGNTVNLSLDQVTVVGNTSSPPSNGVLFEDAGGAWVHRLSVSSAGTAVRPGQNQVVQWFTGSSSYLGDTTTPGVPSMLIDTAHSTGLVQTLSCTDCWASSANGAAGLQVTNTAGGRVNGVRFQNPRMIGNGTAGALIQGGTNVALQGGAVCGTATGMPDVSIALSVSGVKVQNMTLGGGCDAFATTPSAGIVLQGSNADIIIAGNEFFGVTTPISGNPTGDSVVEGNTLASTQAATVASAATVALANAGRNYIVTGTATVTTLTGGWNGRQVRMVTPAAVSFATGGNIAAAVTSAAGGFVDGVYLGGTWYLK